METKGKRIGRNVLAICLVLLVTVASFFCVAFFVFDLNYIRTDIHGSSMRPTLNMYKKDDIGFINKHQKGTRGDIVVADVKWGESGSSIKRLIGLPNDKIRIEEGDDEYFLYVNDEVLYTKLKMEIDKNGITISNYNTYSHYCELISKEDTNIITENGKTSIVLRDDEYFLMGDNWSVSKDSTSQGPVLGEQIIGRVDVIIHGNEIPAFKLFKEIIRLTFKNN